MRTNLVIAATLVAAPFAVSRAEAQRAPDLATLDRGDGITRLGLDAGLSVLDDPPYSAGLRLEIFGQYVTAMGLGIYAAFPISRSFGGSDGPPPEAESTFAIGNFDLGALYVIENNPDISWVFRGGVVVPTASDSYAGFVTNFLSTWPRLTDLAMVAPDAFYIRLSVSPLIHINRLFLRADLGFDLGIDDDDAADELFRFNVGGGVDFDMVALGLELVNIATIDEFDRDDNFLHALTFTARFMGEQFQPFLAVGMPVDSYVRDAIKVYIAGGIQLVTD